MSLLQRATVNERDNRFNREYVILPSTFLPPIYNMFVKLAVQQSKNVYLCQELLSHL